MKAREFGYLLGFRPAPRRYRTEVATFDLPVDGTIRYAQWLHPEETRKVIRQELVDELRTFIRPGDAAIDIGAHTGDSTLPIALAAGPSGVVLALEPNPYVYPVLEENASLNRDKATIVPLNFAATLTPGDYEFRYSDAGYCNGGLHAGTGKWRHGHAFALTVRGENLEAHLRRHFADLEARLRYVKVDAEGFDADVLQSIEGVIGRRRPFLKAEVHKLTTQPQRERLHDFLTGLGYRIFRVASETQYRGPVVERGDVMRVRHYDIFCEPM